MKTNNADGYIDKSNTSIKTFGVIQNDELSSFFFNTEEKSLYLNGKKMILINDGLKISFIQQPPINQVEILKIENFYTATFDGTFIFSIDDNTYYYSTKAQEGGKIDLKASHFVPDPLQKDTVYTFEYNGTRRGLITIMFTSNMQPVITESLKSKIINNFTITRTHFLICTDDSIEIYNRNSLSTSPLYKFAITSLYENYYIDEEFFYKYSFENKNITIETLDRSEVIGRFSFDRIWFSDGVFFQTPQKDIFRGCKCLKQEAEDCSIIAAFGDQIVYYTNDPPTEPRLMIDNFWDQIEALPIIDSEKIGKLDLEKPENGTENREKIGKLDLEKPENGTENKEKIEIEKIAKPDLKKPENDIETTENIVEVKSGDVFAGNEPDDKKKKKRRRPKKQKEQQNFYPDIDFLLQLFHN